MTEHPLPTLSEAQDQPSLHQPEPHVQLLVLSCKRPLHLSFLKSLPIRPMPNGVCRCQAGVADTSVMSRPLPGGAFVTNLMCGVVSSVWNQVTNVYNFCIYYIYIKLSFGGTSCDDGFPVSVYPLQLIFNKDFKTQSKRPGKKPVVIFYFIR